MEKDQVLLKKIKHESDYKAFEKIFNRYYEQLKIWSVFIVKSDSIAEEAVLDVFFKLWDKRKRININTSLKSYLFAAVKNQSIDYLRKNQQENMGFVYPDLRSESAQPDELMNAIELKERIEKSIDELPDQCRIIFRMSRDEGMKYKDIAEKLNISIKTVETQIGRALVKLKKVVYKN